MLVWRWDAPGRCWVPERLPPDSSFALSADALLVPLRHGGRWVLLAGPLVRVNGASCLPLCVLAARDEIRYNDTTAYVDDAPVATHYFAGKSKVRCARCAGGLTDGVEVILCPRCRAHHHVGCWTYHVRCTKCAQATSGAPWVPEPLEVVA